MIFSSNSSVSLVSAIRRFCLGIFLGAAAVSAVCGAVGITVNPDTSRAPISPYIYGTNQDVSGVNFTLRRMGGNRMTGYNWENNASNAGSDYLNQSDNFMTYVFGIPDSQAAIPGIVLTKFHDQSLAAGAPYTIITLPMAGYVAADKSGVVSAGEAAPSARWVPVVNTKPTALSATPDLADGKVYSDELVQFLVGRYGSAATASGIKGYDLDNEPDLWSNTHSRLHPAQPLCAELVTRSVDLAKAVKRIDPAAETLGFVSYGFGGYYDFQGATDWPTERTKGTYRWFIDYYLDQMKKASTTAGSRLLDVLDLHNYSEARGNDTVAARVTDSTDYTNIACNKARLQAPRAFWDPTYVENSWIGQYYASYLPFLPGIKQSVASFYPGTKIGFTEYNFGGEGHVSGGIAQADILGIFGQQGVYLASLWPLHTDLTYSAAAFKLYRNYDGAGSQYGSTAVSASTADAVLSSAYASVDNASSPRLHVIVLNKNYDTSTQFDFTVAGGTTYSSARVFAFDAASATLTERAAVATITGNHFSYTLPPLTAAHFVLQAAVVANVAPTFTTQPVSQSVVVGQPVTFTAAASGSPSPTFQWFKNGATVAGATSATLTLPSVQSNDAATYWVVATNAAGAATSTGAVLTVLAPPAVTTQPLSSAVFAGGSVTFMAAATGSPTPTFQWQKNGITIPGATSASLTLNNVQVGDAGSYALVATNSNGSTTSRFARLVVLVPQANATTYDQTTFPTGVTGGGTVGLDYVLTNIGTRNWGANHYLSIRDSNGTFVAFAPLIGVNAGEKKTVHLSFPAPTAPGSYSYTVQGLESGVEFFSTQTSITLVVLARQANSVTYNSTNFPVTATPGSNLIFNYNVTNTGTKNWGVNHFLTLRNANGVYSQFSSLNGVAPGESKTVNLTVTAPTAPGTYSYFSQALEDSVEFFGAQANLSLTVLAPQPNAIIYTSTRNQDNVTPGATVSLRYSLSNAGTGTWGASHFASLRDGNGAFLAFISLGSVAPLGTETVDFSLIAPTAPGIYTYYVQAFEDGVEFFDSQDLVTLTVLATPIGNAATYNATTFPITAARGASVTFTSNVTNRGTKTWGANHYLSLRDADNVFLSFQPIAGLAPGASKTLTFNFTAPTSPGVYTYHVQGFESGVEFFNMSDNLVLIVP